MTFTIKGKLLTKGSMQVGSNGTAVTKILTGIASACVPQISASSVASGSIAVTNAELGDKVFFTASNPGGGGVMIYGATACGAGGISASYLNIGGAQTTASTMSFSYMLLKS